MTNGIGFSSEAAGSAGPGGGHGALSLREGGKKGPESGAPPRGHGAHGWRRDGATCTRPPAPPAQTPVGAPRGASSSERERDVRQASGRGGLRAQPGLGLPLRTMRVTRAALLGSLAGQAGVTRAVVGPGAMMGICP